MSRRKYVGKPHPKFIKNSKSKIIRIDDVEWNGYVSLIEIIEINEPLLIKLTEKEFYLYGKGYCELNFLPDNKNWQMYAIYDNNSNIIEWYFDITKLNSVDECGNPYCEDLYLDIVLMADGKVIILDEDELQESYNNGIISKNELDLAYNTKNQLIDDGIINIQYLKALCIKLLKQIKDA
jgi:predicted RNA-binding protein associated with RNAse of E/G family